MDCVTPAIMCDLSEQSECDPGGQMVTIHDHVIRHSLNWEEFFGSSLDLSPSLLNIYDDFAASGVRHLEKVDSEDEESPETHIVTSKIKSLPANGQRSRSGILPSLSVPGDRPVSCMESDWTADQPDSKKRPLSLSSMSSASNTSLPRLRKKRANGTAGQSSGHHLTDQVDSRSSVDSGCMDTYRPGDDLSLVSSDQVSLRDDIDSSSTSLHSPSPDSQRPAKMTLNSPIKSSGSQSPTDSHNYRSWTPKNKKSSNSNVASNTSSPTTPVTNSVLDLTSSSQVEKPTNTNNNKPNTAAIMNSKNQEARKRFFADYDEHMRSDQQPATLTPPQSSASLNTPVSENMTSTSVQTALHEKLREDRQSPSQSAKTADAKGDRGSPSRPKRHEGRVGARKDKHGSPSSPVQKTFTRSSRRKESSSSNRDSAEVSSAGYVSYVQRVVTEIIESERTYISSLKDIIQGYLEPFEKILISKEEIKEVECLFGNIREIYEFGCLFLTDLETTGADPIKVAQCFVRHNKGFVIYADYCTNYPRAVDILTKFMKHPEMSELCKERQLSLGHGLPLGAYLLRPVQRILKYHLLLQNIVKSYEKEGKEMEIIQQAFHHMTQMAHHINEMKRRHEHAVRIQEIQSQLEDYVGEDLTRLGELVLESTFRVYGAKASRQVFLFERGLLISKKTDEGMLSCKKFILCSNLMLVEVIPNEPLSFHVIPFDNPRAQYTLQAKNMEQKKKWCQEIKRLILESFKGKIPDSVKSLVMQLGSNHDDDYITKEALEAVRKTQHTAPEYLEKRRFRRKSGTRLPDFGLLKAKKLVNRKNESKLTEMGRRAESKSPDAHRRLLVPQNAIKRRSHSHSVLFVPSSTTADSPATGADSCMSTPVSPRSDLNSSQLSITSLSGSKKEKKAKKDNKKLEEDSLKKEIELLKRPPSFRKAVRVGKIKSTDLTEMVTRSVHLTSPNAGETTGGFFVDSHESHLIRHIDSSSDEEVVDGEQDNSTLEESQAKESISNCFNNSGIISEEKELIMNNSEVVSMLDLDTTNSREQVRTDAKSEKNLMNISLSADNFSLQKGKGRLSRRDQPVGKKRSKEGEASEDGRRVTAFHDTYSKRVAEKNVLRNKTLRLPNTSKHLSVSESEPQSNAKLTNWNSVDKLTAGSMNDLSYLEENPWVKNTDLVIYGSSTDMIQSNRSGSFSTNKLSTQSTTRPRGHSDLTEMMKVASNRENLDWMVYLNRNSLIDKDNNIAWMVDPKTLEAQNNALNHQPYATPPRAFMTTENMKKYHGNAEDNKNSGYRKSGVNAFGSSPQMVTLTKPMVFHVPSLTRSNSTPLAKSMTGHSSHDKRPSSMDIDRLTDESNRMVAEMEEYISNSTEEVRGTYRFPTSLPTITVESEANSNRLSVVSSLSASSYDSQDSSSSDGLVGTLKHKLHVWANQPGARRDSQLSQSSTLTSEEEDAEETEPFTSGNTFDLPSSDLRSWRESRELETVLREHSLGSSFLGSRMANSFPQNSSESVDGPTNITTTSVPLPTSAGEASTRGDNTSQDLQHTSPIFTKEPEESLTSHINTENIKYINTGNALSTKDATISKASNHIPQTAFEISESSQVSNPKTKSVVILETSRLQREPSLESLESNDSFYERRFSVALDSEVFVDSMDIKVNEDPSANAPRKSIKEYVQHIEQKFKPKSPQILEVRRKEPSAMIRQRLETLREIVTHGRHSSSRHPSEEREMSRAKSQPPSQYRNKLPSGFKPDTKWNDDLKIYGLQTSSSRDSLTRSMENLSKSKENLAKPKDFTMSKSRDSSNFNCDHLKTPGHERDANRFIYMNAEQSGNQFIHVASSEDQDEAMSQSITRLHQLSSELDNLVIMKGWVKALISKFQDK